LRSGVDGYPEADHYETMSDLAHWLGEVSGRYNPGLPEIL
jgi:hypothetical protein